VTHSITHLRFRESADSSSAARQPPTRALVAFEKLLLPADGCGRDLAAVSRRVIGACPATLGDVIPEA
ncbi:MAG: hypothetical protein ACREFP_21600, partial [Acetobacteraceae bacterium]